VILYINPAVLAAGPTDAFHLLLDALGNPQVVHLPCEIDEAGEWLVIDNKADYPQSILNSGRFYQVSMDRGLTRGARAFAVAREIAQRHGKTPEPQTFDPAQPPVLFLDFDGVMHPEGGDTSRLFECAPRLWSILRAVPEVQVVFSTSWRFHHSLDELIDFATSGGGEDLAERFVGITPLVKWIDDDRGDYRRREIECLAWRERVGHVGNWLALDDIHAWFSFGSPRVFITDYRTGLSDANVPAIIDRLKEL